MGDWLVYHSRTTMGHNYASLGEHAVYSKKRRPRLCIGDYVWVIEGPGNFVLVDCFQCAETDEGPFFGTYAGFRLKVRGIRSLLQAPVQLDVSTGWERLLHSHFLTKQRFFELIDDEGIWTGLRQTWRLELPREAAELRSET